ncbi:MAG: ABC transporter permease [Planctomycetota bacterium]
MKTPIAIYNLWHQGTKTLVSIGGVAFALLLVFMQLGFMGAVSHTATNVLKKLDCDIVLQASDYLHLYESSSFDRKWLRVAANTDGVDSATPFWIIIQNWRKLPNGVDLRELAEAEAADLQAKAPPDDLFETQYLPIAVMAMDPDDRVFKENVIPCLEKKREELHRDNALLLDDSTKDDYGAWDGKEFKSEDVELSKNSTILERTPEIGGVEFEIIDLFKLGTGLAANGAAIMGKKAFARIYPWDVNSRASLGLIRVRPGQDPAKVARLLRREFRVLEADESESSDLDNTALLGLPDFSTGTAVQVWTLEEALSRENNRWLGETPIGLIFQMGVAISLLVGAAIVYMVLSTDVANRLPEYATLLAMGYSRYYLVGIVMTQALVLCGLGFLTSWALGEILYRVTTRLSGIPLIMTPPTVILVAVLGLLMCVVSGLLALRKLWKAEPASLF